MSDVPRQRGSEIKQEQVANDFDKLTESYEDKINDVIAFGGREHGFYIDVKRDHLLRLASAHFEDVSKIDVLDLGCGIGAYHSRLEGRFNILHGIDVSAESIRVARASHPFVKYESYNGGTLPYRDGMFDLAFAICVMHHVPEPEWGMFTTEMLRVLKPGGLALVFEHNPYNPATQHIVRSCDIDKDAVLLRPATSRRLFIDAGFSEVHTRTILSVPPVNEMLGALDNALGRLPFGAQYYLSAKKLR